MTAVSTFEPLAFGSQAIDVRRLQRGRTITRHIAVTEIIRHDHNDIRMRRTGGVQRNARLDEKEA